MERKRKLQEIGTSFYVALPPDWIRHWKLEKQSILEVSFKGNMLYIQVPPKDDSPITKILRDQEKTDTRKIQYLGKTFYIGLLPAWIKEQKLSQGDILSIQYSNSDIVTVSA